MDFLSTTEFQSKIDPDIKVTIRVVTIGRRMEFLRRQRQAGGDDLESIRIIWEILVKDFEGLTVDGTTPSIIDFFLNGPEDVVNEISAELLRQTLPVGSNDSGDEAAIAAARKQIAEAEARITARKNSGPHSSTSAIQTAANVAETQTRPAGSGSNEIATAAPI